MNMGPQLRAILSFARHNLLTNLYKNSLRRLLTTPWFTLEAVRFPLPWLLLAFATSPFPHTLDHAPTPEKHLIETMPGGLAIFDFDNDRRPDLFFTNAARPSRLYRNLGHNQWQDVTASSGISNEAFTMGAAAADYDQDGLTDLFVTGVNQNRLYRNLGEGRFQTVPFPATGWSISAGWFDFDHDGDLDLFVVNYVQYNPATEPFCGDQKGHYRTYCHPRNYFAAPNSLFRNEGNGKFLDVSRSSGIAAHPGKGMALCLVDYDRDGWLDVVVTNDAVPNFLFRNNHNGTFSEQAATAGIGLNDDGRALSSMGADSRDIDNDGIPELFITALANETFPLFKGLTKGLFQDITYPSRIGAATLALSGWSTGIYDFDNDGHKDIFTANGDVNDNTERFSSRKSKQQNLLLWNTGQQQFRPELIGDKGQHRGAAFADLNDDGAIDIVTSKLGESPSIWLNDRTKANHWLLIDTQLGAEVQIGNQHNQATQAVGYASSSLPQVHFGLGAQTRVDKIVVRFPSGQIKTLTDQPTNRRLTVLPD